MKAPVIRNVRSSFSKRHEEQGVTMILVAISMVAVIAMAALSIDVVTLYLAREEAQRAADAGALAAARVISISGVTGAPTSSATWQSICGGSTSPASLMGVAVAKQSTVGSIPPPIVTVQYSGGGAGPGPDCSSLPFATGVNNPMVTVLVTRGSLPTFFSRMWGNTGNSVSATAVAEVFNPSDSGNIGNGSTGSITAVQPRGIKPWIVPNRDPLYPAANSDGFYCSMLDTTTGLPTLPCNKLVDLGTGQIQHPGISLNGSGTTGVIGERFWLEPNCHHTGSTCNERNPTPVANYVNPVVRAFLQLPPSLEYLPGEAPSSSPVAIPSCSSARPYSEAIAGFDQSTVYYCGVQNSSAPTANQVDLSENPSSGTNDTMNGVTCLIHEGDATDSQPDGQDTLTLTSYPFKVLSGTSNPLLGGSLAGSPVTSSPSIVSLPIYDSDNNTIASSGRSPVTIVGFLQVFINSVDQYGNIDVVVLNVAGCSNGNGADPVSAAVSGSSPVPVRLITPP